MDSNLAVGLLIIVALFVAKTLIIASFSATMNARKSILRELAEDGKQGARRALEISENATPLLATHQFWSILLNLLIVTVLSTIILDTLSESLTSIGLGETVAVAGVVATNIVVFSALLMITDQLATALVLKRAEDTATLSSGLAKTLIHFSAPMVSLIMKITNTVAKLMGGAENAHMTTAEEIKTLVDAGSEEGVLEDEEKEMIYSIIRFGDTLAREVMVPRIDIIAIEHDASLEEALRVIIEGGHSRIPVYQETIDNIIGVLYAKDLLNVWQKGEKTESLMPLLRPAVFVPESKKASELLVELQSHKTHIVFVVDEFGGTAGLLTIEDLLEEIVGEIQDEYDINEEALYEQINEYEYIFNARVDLDDLNHLLDTSIPTDESDTLGGYIFSTLGRVPTIQDEFEDHGLAFKVLSVTGRRIRKVQVRKIQNKHDEETTSSESETLSLSPPKPNTLQTDPLADAGAS